MGKAIMGAVAAVALALVVASPSARLDGGNDGTGVRLFEVV